MARSPLAGDYGLKASTGPWMWLERLGTFSRYGHVVVAASDALPDGSVWVVEAEGSGVRYRKASVTEFTWSNIPLTDAQRAQIVAAAVATEGEPYDYGSIARFVLRVLGIAIPAAKGAAGTAKVICSELVVRCYRAAGIDLFPGRAADDIDPGDLADLLVTTY